MIKKISICVLFIILGLFLSTNSIFASDEPESEDVTFSFFDVYGSDFFGGWVWSSHENTFKNNNNWEDVINFDYGDFTIETYGFLNGIHTKIFVPNNLEYLPDTSKASKIEIIEDYTTIETFYFDYLNDDDTVMYLLNDDGEIEDLSGYKDYSMSIQLIVDYNLGYDDRDSVKTTFDNNLEIFCPWEISYIPVTTPTPDDPNNDDQILSLPITGGSIFDGDFDMGSVTYEVDGYNVEFQIFYNGIYYLNYSFDNETDMSIFNNNFESFYYSYDDVKFIVINHGDQSMFTTRDWRAQTFVPYSIWNLNTNEIVTYQKTSVYLYMTVGDANHIVGYFYTDEFIIDRLMSVSTMFNYRWDPLIGSKSDWIPQIAVLEDTDRTDGTIDWRLQAASISATAAVIGAALPIPGVNLALFLVGSVSAAYFTAVGYEAVIDGNSLLSFSTNEIEEFSPTDSFKQEVNNKYIDSNTDFEGIDLDVFKMWKLDFGAYNVFGKTPEVDPDSISVIEMVYETNGNVYTISSDLINTHGSIDDFLDPDNDSTIFNPTPTQPSINNPLSDIAWYYYVIGGLGLYFIFKEFKLAKKPGLVIILLAIVAYILFTLGLI